MCASVLQPLYECPPLVILNNFGETLPSTPKHLTLTASMFQGMFPALDVGVVKLPQCRRVVLFHYDKVNDSFVFFISGVCEHHWCVERE